MPFKFLFATFVLSTMVQNAKGLTSLNNLDARAICANPSVEGRYGANIQDHGHVDIYLLCTGLNSLSASWIMNGLGATPIALAHFAIDGDQLTLASFSLTPGDAVGIPSNATPAIRLELSINALRAGTLAGNYITASRPQPKRVLGNRNLAFPSILQTAQVASGAPGIFIYDGTLGRSGMRAPVFLYLDVIEGYTRVSVADGGSSYYTLMVGIESSARNDLFIATSGASGSEGVMLPMVQIRGRFLSKDVYEFYYFNTLYGFAGPYRAKRAPSQTPFESANLRPW